jgi:hypothetical protein
MITSQRGLNGECVLRRVLRVSEVVLLLKWNFEKRDAFLVACGDENSFFSKPAVEGSHGASSDGRPFGQHFLAPVSVLPHCDAHSPLGEVTVIFNRDW